MGRKLAKDKSDLSLSLSESKYGQKEIKKTKPILGYKLHHQELAYGP